MIDQESKFNTIGKEMPYTVPPDFFDRLPAKTLQLSKERMEKRRKNKWVVRTLAVLTTAAAVLLLFVIRPLNERQPGSNLLSKQELPVEKVVVPKAQPKSSVQAMNAEVVQSKETSMELAEAENIDDLLQHLSDEDLAQLTAMYGAEDLENDISQETININ